MNKTTRTVIMVTAPLASLMTLAVGLRIGAEAGVHAVSVSATPRSPVVSRGYLRLTAYYDETGVKETVQLAELLVVVRVRDRDQTMTASTNADGILDVPVELPSDLRDDEDIAVRVSRAAEPYPLVEGKFKASALAPEKGAPPLGYRALRPTKQAGDIVVDLSIPDGRVAAEANARAFVRMRLLGAPPANPKVELAPEGGMEGSVVRVCPKEGVAELSLVATFPVTGIGIVVTDGDGADKKKGEWFGAVPVAMGAPRVQLPASEPPAPFQVEVRASNARAGVYVAIDDANGRAFSDYKPLHVTTNGAESAKVDVPALPEGLYFLTASGDPKAIEALDGSAVARPFLVRKEPPNVCSLLDALTPAAAPLKRTPLLDGLYVRRQGDRQKKRRGLFLGILSLTAAGLLEVVLLLSAAKAARADLAARMSEVLDEDEARGIDADEKRSSGVPHMAVAILIAMLGFTLIGAFVIWRT